MKANLVTEEEHGHAYLALILTAIKPETDREEHSQFSINLTQNKTRSGSFLPVHHLSHVDQWLWFHFLDFRGDRDDHWQFRKLLEGRKWDGFRLAQGVNQLGVPDIFGKPEKERD